VSASGFPRHPCQLGEIVLRRAHPQPVPGFIRGEVAEEQKSELPRRKPENIPGPLQRVCLLPIEEFCDSAPELRLSFGDVLERGVGDEPDATVVGRAGRNDAGPPPRRRLWPMTLPAVRMLTRIACSAPTATSMRIAPSMTAQSPVSSSPAP
jgi:hypothetical protein